MAEKSSAKISNTLMNTWELPVKIKPGLFPTEKIVRFQDADGREIAVFVSTDQVDERKNIVLVLVLEEDRRHVLIQVPARGGSTVVKVVKEGIRAATQTPAAEASS